MARDRGIGIRSISDGGRFNLALLLTILSILCQTCQTRATCPTGSLGVSPYSRETRSNPRNFGRPVSNRIVSVPVLICRCRPHFLNKPGPSQNPYGFSRGIV